MYLSYVPFIRTMIRLPFPQLFPSFHPFLINIITYTPSMNSSRYVPYFCPNYTIQAIFHFITNLTKKSTYTSPRPKH